MASSFVVGGRRDGQLRRSRDVTGGERGDTAQRRLRARDTRLAGPRHRAVGLLALPTAAAAARLSCCAHEEGRLFMGLPLCRCAASAAREGGCAQLFKRR
jgi:hypothetical protein